MTVREDTIASIEIENREVAVDVVAPTRLEMLFNVFPRLPDAMDDVEDYDALTPQEQVDAAHVLIDATTDLPLDLIEQLPTSAVEKLGDAASLVIDQQVRHWKRRDQKLEDHLEGVPNDERVQAMYEFVTAEPTHGGPTMSGRVE